MFLGSLALKVLRHTLLFFLVFASIPPFQT